MSETRDTSARPLFIQALKTFELLEIPVVRWRLGEFRNFSLRRWHRLGRRDHWYGRTHWRSRDYARTRCDRRHAQIGLERLEIRILACNRWWCDQRLRRTNSTEGKISNRADISSQPRRIQSGGVLCVHTWIERLSQARFQQSIVPRRHPIA